MSRGRHARVRDAGWYLCAGFLWALVGLLMALCFRGVG